MQNSGFKHKHNLVKQVFLECLIFVIIVIF